MNSSRCIAGWLSAAILLISWPALAHAPYVPTVVFAYPEFPDRPIAAFAQGRLGIVQPGWWRGYRVVAYRYLSDRPLSSAEQRSFLAFKELHPRAALRPSRSDDWRYWTSYRQYNPPQQWVNARARFRRDKPPSGGAQDWWGYTGGDGCLADSFRTATRTLQNRARRYGAQSPKLQQWIMAQDQVFQNCGFERPGKLAVIPAGPSPTASALERADREYQIAAAHFYAGNAEEAVRRFEAIARDPSSPWRDYGLYLAARTVLRQAVPADGSSFDSKLLAAADARLQAAAPAISNPRLRRSISSLRQWVALRLHPQEQFRAVAARIVSGNSGANFGQDVMDLGFLLDHAIGTVPDFPGVNPWDKGYGAKYRQWRDRRYDELREQRTSSDLTDWLMSLESGAADQAVERWQRRRSLPWLVAALSLTHGRADSAVPLIEAAAQVAPESAAYPTVAFHRARLLRERGEADAARRILDHLLQQSSNWPTSAANRLREERLRLTDSVAAFVHFLPLQPVGFDNGSVTRGESEYCDAGSPYRSFSSMACEPGVFEAGTPRHFLPQLDDEAARMLNQSATLELLMAVARWEGLPHNIRQQIAPAVWVRAMLLDRPQEAAGIATVAAEMRPELKPFIAQCEQAKTEEERRFAAAFAIAHFPGLRPAVNGSTPRVTRFDNADDYRDNWWCGNGLPAEFASWPERNAPPAAAPEVPFLPTEERARAASEFKRVAAVGDAGDWLASVLIAWAKDHPQDPRSPEALHFAWRATRYGCNSKSNRSREIFLLLHRRYPDSIWTKKTRVWW